MSNLFITNLFVESLNMEASQRNANIKFDEFLAGRQGLLEDSDTDDELQECALLHTYEDNDGDEKSDIGDTGENQCSFWKRLSGFLGLFRKPRKQRNLSSPLSLDVISDEQKEGQLSVAMQTIGANRNSLSGIFFSTEMAIKEWAWLREISARPCLRAYCLAKCTYLLCHLEFMKL